MNEKFRCTCLAAIASLMLPVPHALAEEEAQGLTLTQAVSAALEGNPALSRFEFLLLAQEGRVRQAALRPATEVSLEIENFGGSGDVSGLESAETTLALSQIVELGGKRDARIGVAEAGKSALEVERQAAQLDVLAEVTRRFIAVAQRQERLQLAGESVDLAEKTVEASERRVRAAKSPRAEMVRASIALGRARLDARAAQAALDSARHQLAATWGESRPRVGGRPFGGVRADLFSLPPTGNFDELVARLAGNPELLRFASESRLRDAEVRLATALRRLDITVGAGVRRLDETDDQALVASFAVPLFTGRRAAGLIDEARANRSLVDAERRAAQVRAQAALYELHRELARAVSEAQTLREEIEPRSAEALRDTQYAYERGRYGYLELVDAQREYLGVQAALIDAAASAHALRAEIERLTNSPLSGVVP